MTACFEKYQTITCAAIGASFIAPYMGRMNDLGKNGIKEVIEMHKILKGFKSNSQLLVASIRELSEICELASMGINNFTISPQLARKLINVEHTINAAQEFEEDSKYHLN